MNRISHISPSPSRKDVNSQQSYIHVFVYIVHRHFPHSKSIIQSNRRFFVVGHLYRVNESKVRKSQRQALVSGSRPADAFEHLVGLGGDLDGLDVPEALSVLEDSTVRAELAHLQTQNSQHNTSPVPERQQGNSRWQSCGSTS